MEFTQFKAYYSDPHGFALHFGRMVQSFIQSMEHQDGGLNFYGFGVNQLMNLDTICMNHEKEKLVLPIEEDAVYLRYLDYGGN